MMRHLNCSWSKFWFDCWNEECIEIEITSLESSENIHIMQMVQISDLKFPKLSQAAMHRKTQIINKPLHENSFSTSVFKSSARKTLFTSVPHKYANYRWLFKKKKTLQGCRSRWGPGGTRGPDPTDFGRSVNPIQTRRVRLCLPHYKLPPSRMFHPSYGPGLAVRHRAIGSKAHISKSAD